MLHNQRLQQVKNTVTGAAFILFPLIFVFAFMVHPGLLTPHLLSPQELIFRAHQNSLLQFGHVLVTLNTALLVAAALHFSRQLESTPAAWLGYAGACLAIVGALMLAADKGAFCLTMSALDTISQKDFMQMMPGLLAIFSRQGWMALLWGIVLLPVGFAIQAIGLLRTRRLPYWQTILFLIGVVFVAVPDGMEVINLSASILMAIALVPYGIRVIHTPARE